MFPGLIDSKHEAYLRSKNLLGNSTRRLRGDVKEGERTFTWLHRGRDLFAYGLQFLKHWMVHIVHNVWLPDVLVRIHKG